MTVEEAKKLTQGQTVYHATKRNADGSAMRGKVLSIKTWKRKPDVVVSLKHGLYDFAKFYNTDVSVLCLISPTLETHGV